MFGLLMAAALLLGAAGILKVASPKSPTVGGDGVIVARLSGLAELAVAGLVIVNGGRPAAALLAVTFAALAVVSGRMATVSPGRDCGCFGATPSPVSHWHTALNVSAALIGAAAAVWPVGGLGGLGGELSRQPLFGLPIVAAAIILAWLAYAVMTVLPLLSSAHAQVLADR